MMIDIVRYYDPKTDESTILWGMKIDIKDNESYFDDMNIKFFKDKIYYALKAGGIPKDLLPE